jgi:thiol:disulfide interchange protein
LKIVMNNTNNNSIPRWLIGLSGACALAAIILIPVFSGGQPPPVAAAAVERPADQISTVNWFDSLEHALAEAQRNDKPILIDFVAEWCPPCQMMDKHVWPQDAVQSMLRGEVVPLRITMDGPKPPQEAAAYGVEFLPTIVLTNPRGEEIDRVGYVDREELLEFVRSNSRN